MLQRAFRARQIFLANLSNSFIINRLEAILSLSLEPALAATPACCACVLYNLGLVRELQLDSVRYLPELWPDSDTFFPPPPLARAA